jgi:hypothetical protein
MSDYLIKGETLTDIADTIREKTSTKELIVPEAMANGVTEVYSKGVSDGENNVFVLMRSNFFTNPNLNLSYMFYGWEWEYMCLPVQLTSSQGSALNYTFFFK